MISKVSNGTENLDIRTEGRFKLTKAEMIPIIMITSFVIFLVLYEKIPAIKNAFTCCAASDKTVGDCCASTDSLSKGI